MLCAPPMCAPAGHFLGCFSLRTGAAVVVTVDTIYGIILIVIHAIMLGTLKEPPGQTGRIIPPQHESLHGHDHGNDVNRLLRRLDVVQEVVGNATARMLYAQDGAAGMQSMLGSHAIEGQHQQQFPESGEHHADLHGQSTGWMLQFMDLDFGFGHQLLGLTDQCNIVIGLVYGCIVTVICLYMLQAIVGAAVGTNLPKLSRFFTSFAHMQLLIYLFISFVKLPKLCHPIQSVYLTHLYMECDVLWFVFAQRALLVIVAGSFMIWIFASFSFVLTFGTGAHSAVDKPEYHQGLDVVPERGAWKGGYPGAGPGGPPPPGSMPPPPNSRLNMVGPAVSAPPPHQSFRGGGSDYHGGGGGGGYGYHPNDRGGGGGGGYDRGRTMAPSGGPQSYNVGRMPRASSSMATSATGASEHHPLIKPPVAVY